MADLIQSDQTGFVRGREIFFNLRRPFNIMYHKHKDDSAVIALDAENSETIWLPQ